MRVFTIIIIILAVIVVFAGLGFLYFTSLLNAPQTGASVKTVTFEITSGQGVKEISKNLHTAGLIRSATAFEYYVWMEGVGSDIQAGKYELNTGQKASAIIEKITKGDVTENEVEFQVLEGWSMVDIAEQYGETFSSPQKKNPRGIKLSLFYGGGHPLFGEAQTGLCVFIPLRQAKNGRPGGVSFSGYLSAL